MSRLPFDLPPGLFSDDSRLASKGRWADGSNVRFRDGRPEIIGGWESITSSLLTGVCRTVFQWTDKSNAPTLNIAFGTHSKLQVWVGGQLYDITPTLALPEQTLGSNPIATTNLSSTVVVTQAGHPHAVGESVTITGATAVATVTINGTWTITAVTTDTWSFTAGSSANATTTGGGSAVIAKPNKAFAAGAIDGTGGSGFGTGAWDVGTFGSPSTADYWPRTWSLAAWGGYLVGSPRGGTIHVWQNGTGTPAAPIKDAPARVRAILVSNTDQIFALGCNEEASGVYNPLCIRYSGVRRINEWSTLTPVDSTSREYVLPGGGEIVSGRNLGPYLLVWTTKDLFVGYFTGNLDAPWKFDRVGENCGLVGPNAAVVRGQRAYWWSPDGQFRTYTFGGEPQVLDCPISLDALDNIAASQSDKIVASMNSKFDEVRFDYPDARDGLGYENSRYLAMNVATGAWYRGQMERTAMCDSGPSDSPIGVTYGGNVYWHERGTSADGAPIPWYIESGEVFVSADRTALLRGMFPDTKDQVGPWDLTLFTRIKPNGPYATYGPYTFASDTDQVDFMATGWLFRVRFSGSSSPAQGRLGVPQFDYKLLGKR